MNFLTPLFLLGALAVAAPVLFHLIRRATRTRQRFSSLLFLRPDPPKLARRSRVDQWPLLLLRAAALALLALAFARPYLRTALPAADASGAMRRSVLLLDTSASMSRPGLRDSALAKAGELLQAARPQDQWTILTFDTRTRTLLSFPEWTALPPENRAASALARLRELPPSWAGTNLTAALTESAELLSVTPERAGPVDGKGPGGEGLSSIPAAAEGGGIFLISDFQEGSRTDGLQGREWPRGVQVTALAVKPAGSSGNAGLLLAPEASGGSPPSGGPDKPALRVRVANAPAAGTASPETVTVTAGALTQFQAGWAAADGSGFAGGGAEDLVIPPGQSRLLTLPWPDGPAVPGRVLLRGDDAFFDNSLFVLPPTARQVAVWCSGGGPPEDPRQLQFFLSQALPQTVRLRAVLQPLDPQAPPPALSALSPAPDSSSVLMAAAPLSRQQAEFFHAQAAGGRTVTVVLTGAAMAESLAIITGLPAFPLEEAPSAPSGYAMWSGLDFRHPLFLAFADPRFSDFTKIRFWKHRRPAAGFTLPEQTEILAAFDSGGPALAAIPAGAGRVLVFFSGWHPADSQLALSSKFVPLMASLLEWSGAAAAPPPQFTAGGPVPMAALGFTEAGAFPVRITGPDGWEATVEAASPLLPEAPLPGHYTATASPGYPPATTPAPGVPPPPAAAIPGALTRHFAVNPDPMESRTAPLQPDTLERLGVPVLMPSLPAHAPGRASSVDSSPMAPAAETENRQKLWRQVIALALGILLFETFLAGLRARPASAPVPAPDTASAP